MHSLENHTGFQTKTAQKPNPLGLHIPIWQIQESTPPPPPHGYSTKYSSLCYPKSSITYRFVTFCAEPQVSSRLGVNLQIKIISKISINEKELFPSYKTVDKK